MIALYLVVCAVSRELQVPLYLMIDFILGARFVTNDVTFSTPALAHIAERTFAHELCGSGR